jgi:hypothetical protein
LWLVHLDKQRTAVLHCLDGGTPLFLTLGRHHVDALRCLSRWTSHNIMLTAQHPLQGSTSRLKLTPNRTWVDITLMPGITVFQS